MEGLGGNSQRINKIFLTLFIESEGPVNPVCSLESITSALKNQPRSGTTMLARERKQLPTDIKCNHLLDVPFVDGVMLGVCNMYFI